MGEIWWYWAPCTVAFAVTCTPGPDAAERVQYYVELHQTGDVEGLLALHAEDAEFEFPGQNPIRGPAALRDHMSWDAALGPRLVMEDHWLGGDPPVFETLIDRDKCFESLSLPEAVFHPGTCMEPREGRIMGTTVANFDEEATSRVITESELLIQRISENRPGDSERLLPSDNSRYDAAGARPRLEFMDDWNQAKWSTE